MKHQKYLPKVHEFCFSKTHFAAPDMISPMGPEPKHRSGPSRFGHEGQLCPALRTLVQIAAKVGAPVHLTEIALRIGRLPFLCNQLLCEAEEGTSRNRRLTGPAEKKAIKRIMATCDAVTQELREIASCAHIRTGTAILTG